MELFKIKEGQHIENKKALEPYVYVVMTFGYVLAYLKANFSLFFWFLQ